MGHHWRPVQTADHRGPVWSRVAVINEDLNIGNQPSPTVGLIIQTGIGKVDLNAAPLPVSSSGPTGSRRATSRPHRPHRRSARTAAGRCVAPPACPPDRWRQVAAQPAAQAGQGAGRHPVAEAEAKSTRQYGPGGHRQSPGRCRNAGKSTTRVIRGRSAIPDAWPRLPCAGPALQRESGIGGTTNVVDWRAIQRLIAGIVHAFLGEEAPLVEDVEQGEAWQHDDCRQPDGDEHGRQGAGG